MWNKLIIWTLIFLIYIFMSMVSISIQDINGALSCVMESECNLLLIMATNAIAFPSSMLWLCLLGLIMYISDEVMVFMNTHIMFSTVLAIFGFYIIGFIQWFVLFPKIYRTVSRKLKKMRPPTR